MKPRQSLHVYGEGVELGSPIEMTVKKENTFAILPKGLLTIIEYKVYFFIIKKKPVFRHYFCIVKKGK